VNSILQKIAQATLEVLRATTFAGSRNQRAIAEAIADAIADNWVLICSGLAQNPRSGYPPRHMADVSCELSGKTCWIDIKTRNVEKGFNMPNITAVKRLDKFYSTPTNCFLILMVEYRLDANGNVVIQAVDLFPVESLDWSCLHIVALGRGQLQIADAKHIVLNRRQTRQQWLRQFYGRLVAFYEREMKKDQRDLRWAQDRLTRFMQR
jgi:hypothetical protein